MSWVLAASAAVVLALQQPTPSAPSAKPWPILSLSVLGNQNYSREQILAVAGLKLGQLATPRDFEAARDRLAATGAFESIEFRFAPAEGGKGYAVSFHLVEAGPFFPVRFEELGLPDQEIRAYLRELDPLFGDKIAPSQALLDRYARAIEQLLESRGRRQAVIGRLMAEADEAPAVVFRPAALPLPVAEVRFANNHVIPAVTLQRAIHGVAIGVRYNERRFRQLLEASVRPLYEARGHVRVSFPEVRTEPAGDVKGLVVIVTVEEGPVYQLGEVRFEGGPLETAELARTAELKSGAPFDAARVQAALERIEKRLRRDGYMRARVAAERRIDDAARKVDLAVRVEPGPQYIFGKLIIEGLDLIAEAAIRRMWTLKPGQPFRADYPDYFLERIREEGVLENLKQARAELQSDDAERRVDVILRFR